VNASVAAHHRLKWACWHGTSERAKLPISACRRAPQAENFPADAGAAGAGAAAVVVGRAPAALRGQREGGPDSGACLVLLGACLLIWDLLAFLLAN
jgi:hypothetical protein